MIWWFRRNILFLLGSGAVRDKLNKIGYCRSAMYYLGRLMTD